MSYSWHSDDHPADVAIGPLGWALALLRGVPLAIVTFGGLALLLLVRLVERPLFDPRRPLTPHITQFVCRSAFLILGLRRHTHGTPMRGAGVVVANHASWLDIFALNAGQRVCFVSKSDVRDWPAIGWLARATGTVFIERHRRQVRDQRNLLAERLRHDQTLLFFPEGTSTDGRRVLPFRTALFEALFGAARDTGQVQPVAVIYHAPPGADPRHYGWWGDMDFGVHLLRVLATPRQGSVDVVYLPPTRVAAHADRKALARACESAIAVQVKTHLD